jgi:hypothetical protein
MMIFIDGGNLNAPTPRTPQGPIPTRIQMKTTFQVHNESGTSLTSSSHERRKIQEVKESLLH